MSECRRDGRSTLLDDEVERSIDKYTSNIPLSVKDVTKAAKAFIAWSFSKT